jgi:PadR family transcriptional regulator PadR
MTIEPGKKSDNRKAQLKKGVVDMALLALLQKRPRYGLELLEGLNADGGLDVAEGTIYPLLHRLEAAGDVEARWQTETENKRPRKYYALTDSGREQLAGMVRNWIETRDRIDDLIRKACDDE